MTKAEATGHADNLKEVFNNVKPTTQDITVYREVSKKMMKEIGADGTFTDKGFVSTTATQSQTAMFQTSSSVTLEIKIPKGSKALKLSNNDLEDEVLLNAGSRFQQMPNGTFELIG
jgi:hypothetical protein